VKPVYSIRLDKKLIEKARAKGLDITKIVEVAIAKALNFKKCPYCGRSKK